MALASSNTLWPSRVLVGWQNCCVQKSFCLIIIIIICCCRNSLFKHESCLFQKFFFLTCLPQSFADFLCLDMCLSSVVVAGILYFKHVSCLLIVAEFYFSSISLICYCSDSLFKHVSQLFVAEILWLGWNCYNKRL
jgi:hypothetical protein